MTARCTNKESKFADISTNIHTKHIIKKKYTSSQQIQIPNLWKFKTSKFQTVSNEIEEIYLQIHKNTKHEENEGGRETQKNQTGTERHKNRVE